MPLAALFDESVLGDEEFDGRGVRILAGAYRYGGVRVWGATAFTLGMLAHVLRPERGPQRRVCCRVFSDASSSSSARC